MDVRMASEEEGQAERGTWACGRGGIGDSRRTIARSRRLPSMECTHCCHCCHRCHCRHRCHCCHRCPCRHRCHCCHRCHCRHRCGAQADGASGCCHHRQAAAEHLPSISLPPALPSLPPFRPLPCAGPEAGLRRITCMRLVCRASHHAACRPASWGSGACAQHDLESVTVWESLGAHLAKGSSSAARCRPLKGRVAAHRRLTGGHPAAHNVDAIGREREREGCSRGACG